MSAWNSRRDDEPEGRPNDHRDVGERDRARIVHSAGFRRLQAKTQVLGIGDTDFHRTRLTHSMEVGQLAQGLVGSLRKRYGEHDIAEHLPSRHLIEAVAFGHDIGHPPFGHGGEVALNGTMAAQGGFEGNGQTLRMLARLESHTPNHGLNLSRRTLLGLLKYPSPYSRVRRLCLPAAPKRSQTHRKDEAKPPKCYLDSETDVVEWIMDPLADEDRELFVALATQPTEKEHGGTRHKSLDCSIMDLADDISYGVHDLEDAVALGLIIRDQWERVVPSIDKSWFEAHAGVSVADLTADLFGAKRPTPDEVHRGAFRKKAVGAMVNALVTSVHPEEHEEFEEPLLRWRIKFSEPAQRFVKALKELVFRLVISDQVVESVEYKGQVVVAGLFAAISDHPERLLPRDFVDMWRDSDGEAARDRVVCDYVGGMTDSYAERMYQRLFLPGFGSIFDRL